jgi:hypothetical protein
MTSATPKSQLDEQIKQVLQNLGLTPSRITEISRNRLALTTISHMISHMIDVDGLTEKNISLQQANLVASLSISSGNLDTAKQSFIVANVLDGRIKAQTQLAGRICFC